jgi:hypothetical protein
MAYQSRFARKDLGIIPGVPTKYIWGKDKSVDEVAPRVILKAGY